MALDVALSEREILVIAAPADAPDGLAMLREARRGFRPRLMILWQRPDDAALSETTPMARDKVMLDGKATAYLCRGRTCLPPANTPEQLARLLDSRPEKPG
jgi:hypothetical protein